MNLNDKLIKMVELYGDRKDFFLGDNFCSFNDENDVFVTVGINTIEG